jgi:hypothetical protein
MPIVSIISSLVGALLRCTPCLIALAVGVAWLAGDIHGHRKADAACRAADIAMQLKAAQRDATIAADTARLAQSQADDLSKLNEDLNRKVSDYESSLKNRPGPGCPLSADDLRRLRNVGQP